MPKKQPMRLEEFMKEQQRKDCPVCQLPDDIRQQLAEASRKKIKRVDQVLWLTQEVGVGVTDADLTKHYSGRH